MAVKKKTVSCLLLTVLAVSCLSGCGGEFTDGTGKPGGAVSGRAVSGGVVSGGAVSDESVSDGPVSGGAVKEKGAGEDVQVSGWFEPFCSGNCGYYFSNDVDDGSEELVQVSLKDGKEKKYKMSGLFELVYVGEDELVCREREKDTLYTVPIVSRADGIEEVKPDAAKQIAGVPDSLDYEGAVYADEQYIIYCREGKAEVRCYNRKTGQTSEMPMQGKIKEMVADNFEWTRRIGERLYFWTMPGDILCWQMDENKVYSYDGNEWYQNEDICIKDGVFAIENSKDNRVGKDTLLIDVVGQKKTKIISNGDAGRLLKQELGDVRFWSMENLFLDGSRVYVRCDVERVEDNICYVQSVVLSREIDGSGELKYERKLTEELMAAVSKAGGVREDPWENIGDGLCTDDISGIAKVQHYVGYCVISGGKAYMVVGEGEKVSTYYNLKTGACKAVKKGDWEYHALNIIMGERCTRKD